MSPAPQHGRGHIPADFAQRCICCSWLQWLAKATELVITGMLKLLCMHSASATNLAAFHRSAAAAAAAHRNKTTCCIPATRCTPCQMPALTFCCVAGAVCQAVAAVHGPHQGHARRQRLAAVHVAAQVVLVGGAEADGALAPTLGKADRTTQYMCISC
jgi:hypothetical protein